MAEGGHVHIEGMGAYNGDWPIDVSYFTNRELHTIKQISGARAGELEEAFESEDNDLIVAFAVVALQRAGLRVDLDAIWDAAVGKITLVVDESEAEGDESPPAEAPPIEPVSTRSGAEKNGFSGDSSRSDGDPLPNVPSPTGSPV